MKYLVTIPNRLAGSKDMRGRRDNRTTLLRPCASPADCDRVWPQADGKKIYQLMQAGNVKADEKEIAYAYPESIAANDCGFFATGCYVVRIVDWQSNQFRMHGGFATWQEARNAADKLAEPYSTWSMQSEA